MVSYPGSSLESDFDYLSHGGEIKDMGTKYGNGKIAILPDGTKIISRPGSRSMEGSTIEIQRPDGKSVVKIRYPEK